MGFRTMILKGSAICPAFLASTPHAVISDAEEWNALALRAKPVWFNGRFLKPGDAPGLLGPQYLDKVRCWVMPLEIMLGSNIYPFEFIPKKGMPKDGSFHLARKESFFLKQQPQRPKPAKAKGKK